MKNIFRYMGIALMAIGTGIFIFWPIVAIVALIIGIIFLVLSFTNPKREKVDNYLEEALKEVCSAEVIYRKRSVLSAEVIDQAKILGDPARIYNDDYLRDTYKGVVYDVYDARLEMMVVTQTHNGRVASYLEYFRGAIFVFDYKEDLPAELYIVSNKLTTNIKLESIESESIQLNQKYNFYTTDKTQAFSILTPNLINKIIELNKLVGGVVSYAFTKDKLYIAINNNADYLSVNQVEKSKQKEKLMNDLMLPQAIINEFNLDKGIYNKN